MATAPGRKERQRIMRALERRSGLVCFYCDKVLIRSSYGVQPDLTSQPIATIEHLRPLGLGGTNALNNLVLSCRPCQRERHE